MSIQTLGRVSMNNVFATQKTCIVRYCAPGEMWSCASSLLLSESEITIEQGK